MFNKINKVFQGFNFLENGRSEESILKNYFIKLSITGFLVLKFIWIWVMIFQVCKFVSFKKLTINNKINIPLLYKTVLESTYLKINIS